MKNPHEEALTPEELAIFTELQDIKTVFDVGARTSLDYLAIKPEAEYHLFEPAPKFYEWLLEECRDKPNVHVNCFGLGDVEGSFPYDEFVQGFHGGKSDARKTEVLYPVKTLDGYVREHNIGTIDFLKIDTEGYDAKVLHGGIKVLETVRYIQYEHWENLQEFHSLLEGTFTMNYIGHRNVFCTRK